MGLRTLNIVVACIQGILAIAIIVLLVFPPEKASGSEFRVYSGEYLGPGNSRTLVTGSNTMLAVLLLGFTLITCAFHVWYATEAKVYKRMVISGNNSFRWLEYSITATIMIVVLAMSSGVYELSTQILIGAAIASTMVCGDIVEKALRVSPNPIIVLSATFIGWFLLVVVFSLIFKSFVEVTTRAGHDTSSGIDEDEPGVPWFVYVILFGLFAFYGSFGGLQVADIIRTRRTPRFSKYDAERLERNYTITSVVSKTFLVIFLLSGVYARN